MRLTTAGSALQQGAGNVGSPSNPAGIESNLRTDTPIQTSEMRISRGFGPRTTAACASGHVSGPERATSLTGRIMNFQIQHSHRIQHTVGGLSLLTTSSTLTLRTPTMKTEGVAAAATPRLRHRGGHSLTFKLMAQTAADVCSSGLPSDSMLRWGMSILSSGMTRTLCGTIPALATLQPQVTA